MAEFQNPDKRKEKFIFESGCSTAITIQQLILALLIRRIFEMLREISYTQQFSPCKKIGIELKQIILRHRKDRKFFKIRSTCIENHVLV